LATTSQKHADCYSPPF
ncbi:hypothetical protein D049_1418B, partial [Vibrio parahaemolyticus VPTS-2010]